LVEAEIDQDYSQLAFEITAIHSTDIGVTEVKLLDEPAVIQVYCL